MSFEARREQLAHQMQVDQMRTRIEEMNKMRYDVGRLRRDVRYLRGISNRMAKGFINRDGAPAATSGPPPGPRMAPEYDPTPRRPASHASLRAFTEESLQKFPNTSPARPQSRQSPSRPGPEESLLAPSFIPEQQRRMDDIKQGKWRSGRHSIYPMLRLHSNAFNPLQGSHPLHTCNQISKYRTTLRERQQREAEQLQERHDQITQGPPSLIQPRDCSAKMLRCRQMIVRCATPPAQAEECKQVDTQRNKRPATAEGMPSVSASVFASIVESSQQQGEQKTEGTPHEGGSSVVPVTEIEIPEATEATWEVSAANGEESPPAWGEPLPPAWEERPLQPAAGEQGPQTAWWEAEDAGGEYDGRISPPEPDDTRMAARSTAETPQAGANHRRGTSRGAARQLRGSPLSSGGWGTAESRSLSRSPLHRRAPRLQPPPHSQPPTEGTSRDSLMLEGLRVDVQCNFY